MHKTKLILRLELDLAWDDGDYFKKPTEKSMKKAAIKGLKHDLQHGPNSYLTSNGSFKVKVLKR